MAGTNGFYLPFILRTVGSRSQALSVGLQCASFLDEIQRERGGEPDADSERRFTRAGADAAAPRERVASGG
jgi:hypothetical protein